MAKVTEKDIVEYLKEKISFHQQEAKRLESLLGAFIQSPAATQKIDEEAVAAPSEKLPSTRKTSAAKPRKGKITESQTVSAIDVPEKYTDNLSINSKIAFALHEIGSGFKEDIANAMAQYEPKSDAEKISRQISAALSGLKAKGQINVEKQGRKYRFQLSGA